MRLTFSCSRLWWLIDVNDSRSSKIVMTRTNSAHVLLRRMRATVKANITVDSRSPTDRSQCRPRQLLLIDLVEIEQQLHVDSVDSNAATYQPRSTSNHRLMLFTSAPPRDTVAHETAFAWGMLVAASGHFRRFAPVPATFAHRPKADLTRRHHDTAGAAPLHCPQAHPDRRPGAVLHPRPGRRRLIASH